jgi:aminopeptidase N
MDLGSFLAKTESYLTPYVWGDYNILILPSAMPDNIAGMENPLLTIAAPEMVTGSTVTVAMHELAHSWFGNLLTCKNWEDFWLNESFTVFTERKMTEKIFGKNAAKWEAFSGNAYLVNYLSKFGDKNPYSALKLHLLQGTNPELSQSNV